MKSRIASNVFAPSYDLQPNSCVQAVAGGSFRTYAALVMLYAVLVTSHSLKLHTHLLHGLSDPSRLRILEALRREELRVSDVVERTGLSQPNASKHLSCLWGCGLVAREKRGREVFYRLIEGVQGLLASVEAVLEEAGETVGACPLTAETVGGGGGC